MVQVVKGEIVKHQLPRTGWLSDGRSVSGYHLLPEETLIAEGWLPLEDSKPFYNSETHYVEVTGYDVKKDKVVKQYQVKPIPEPEPTIEDRLEILEGKVSGLEMRAKE